MLKREQLLSAIRGPIETIDVPELGGELGIRRLSAMELVALRESMPEDEARTTRADLKLSLLLLSMGLCDGEGKPLCTPEELEAWDGEKRDVLHRLVLAVQEHNGMLETQREESEKNSESGPTSDVT